MSLGLIRKNMIGNKYGRLTVLAESDYKVEPELKAYRCLCECGREHVASGSRLRKGRILSCGCLRGEVSDKTVRNTVLYRTWCDMKQRCYNPKNWAYKYYGARGITVCDEWKNSFLTFASDMGERPEGMSIDRIDNDKGYSKLNCKWSTKKEQIDNRRPTHEWGLR
jgi:hypothetical protein